MRAELGDPSVMLHYFRNEGVNRGPLLGPLNDISGKVRSNSRYTWGYADIVPAPGDGGIHHFLRPQSS